jgi:DNA-binding FadR family transcriptional regulator
LPEVRGILELEIAALTATRTRYITMMREAVAVMDRSRRDHNAFLVADPDFERHDPKAMREEMREHLAQIRENSQVAATGQPARLRTVS